MGNQGDIKEKVKSKYGKIALVGNDDACCMPSEYCCLGAIINPI